MLVRKVKEEGACEEVVKSCVSVRRKEVEFGKIICEE